MKGGSSQERENETDRENKGVKEKANQHEHHVPGGEKANVYMHATSPEAFMVDGSPNLLCRNDHVVQERGGSFKAHIYKRKAGHVLFRLCAAQASYCSGHANIVQACRGCVQCFVPFSFFSPRHDAR